MPVPTMPTSAGSSDVVQEVLDELGAVGYPKTSGGKGLHIYVRIPPDHGFADVRRAAWRSPGRSSGAATGWWT